LHGRTGLRSTQCFRSLAATAMPDGCGLGRLAAKARSDGLSCVRRPLAMPGQLQ